MFVQLSGRGYHNLFSPQTEDTIFIQLSGRGYHIYSAIRQRILWLFSSHAEVFSSKTEDTMFIQL